MGIGFVFIIYLIILAILLVPATALCAGIGYFLARKSSRKIKRTVILTACSLPMTGCVYLIGCIIIIGIVGLASGRDVGFGGFEIPLHNHYHWSAIDTPESADIYDQNDQRATDGKGNFFVDQTDRNAFANVLELQEEGNWLAGAYGSHDSRFDNPPGKQVPDHWFLFNTRTHQRVDARSEADLQAAATSQRLHFHMQSSDAFYSTHRYTWVDGIAVILLLIPPVSGIIFLWKRIRKLLRTG